jgi:predicted nuclease of predicted toxin-antitoxin system
MEILFDGGVPRRLRKHLAPHRVTTTQQLGWDELSNGDLLREAEQKFDVLISTDSNIEYQQRLSDRHIALIVLRGEKLAYHLFLPLMPECLEALQTIQPGEVVYLYTDKMKEIMARRGRK